MTKAKAKHVMQIAQNIREADRIEIEATHSEDTSILQALFRSYRISTHCWTGILEDDKKPVIIFGVAPISVVGQEGAPWLVGTDRVKDCRRQFMQECKGYLDSMQAAYPQELHNFVDVRNDISIRWLKWLGFEFDEEVQYGRNGEPFYPFTRRAA